MSRKVAPHNKESKMSFKLEQKEYEGHQIIQVEGELDVYTAPQLKMSMINVLESGAKNLIIDGSKIEYIDTTAMTTLLGGRSRLVSQYANGRLVVVGLSDYHKRKFETQGLDKILFLQNTLAEAIEFLKKES